MVDAVFAELERVAVVKVKNDLGMLPTDRLGILNGTLGHIAEQDGVGIVARTLRDLKDNGGLGFGSGADDGLKLLHVVEIECRNGITAVNGLGKHLASVYKTKFFVINHFFIDLRLSANLTIFLRPRLINQHFFLKRSLISNA